MFLIPTLTGGGAERVIVTLLRHLDRSKFRLALAVVDLRNEVFLAEVPKDVEFIDLKCSRVRFALPKILQIIWQRRPDVVFSTLGHLNLALAILKNFFPPKIKLIARETIVVSEGLHRYLHPDWWAFAYRRFYGRIDRLVCQSLDMRDDLVKNYNFPASKVVVINNPCAVENIRRLCQEKIESDLIKSKNVTSIIKLVAAGRLVHQKGFDLLIEAIAICSNPNLHLTILGEGPLMSDLISLAQKLNISEQIFFAGFQKNPYPYIHQADAFVLSSRFEGFPNVVIEALACGTPVIATPAPGGVKEILNGIEGCQITSSLNAIALAKCISSFEVGSRINEAAVEIYKAEFITKKYANEF